MKGIKIPTNLILKIFAGILVVIIMLVFVLPLVGFKWWELIITQPEKMLLKESAIATAPMEEEMFTWYDYSGYLHPDDMRNVTQLKNDLNSPPTAVSCSDCSGCSGDKCNRCKCGSASGTNCRSCFTGSAEDLWCNSGTCCYYCDLPGKSLCEDLKEAVYNAYATGLNRSVIGEPIAVTGLYDVKSEFLSNYINILKGCKISVPSGDVYNPNTGSWDPGPKLCEADATSLVHTSIYGPNVFKCIERDKSDTSPCDKCDEADIGGIRLCKNRQTLWLGNMFVNKLFVWITTGGERICASTVYICKVSEKGKCNGDLPKCSDNPKAENCKLDEYEFDDNNPNEKCKTHTPCPRSIDYSGQLNGVEAYVIWKGIACSYIDEFYVTAYSQPALSYPICQAESNTTLPGNIFAKFTESLEGKPGWLKLMLSDLNVSNGVCKFNIYACSANSFAEGPEDATIAILNSLRYLDPSFNYRYSSGVITLPYFEFDLERSYSADEILKAVQTGLDDWMYSTYPDLYFDSPVPWLNAANHTGFGDLTKSGIYNVYKSTDLGITLDFNNGCMSNIFSLPHQPGLIVWQCPNGQCNGRLRMSVMFSSPLAFSEDRPWKLSSDKTYLYPMIAICSER
ncbi:MAG: hypothetical protein QW751_01640 [Candidatus Aenigmatarchaeota archaeon]